jgi:tetratricopeptide (TPR) repeat protein
MLWWLRGLAAVVLCWGMSAGAVGQPVDCGAAPTAKCLASVIFKLAKTLPDDSYFRRHVAFAEQELAPGNVKVTLDYVHSDAPDPSPWEDIDWIAQSGRFDRAIQVANERTSAVERLGGLLAVATQLLEKTQTVRATKIVDEVERALASVHAEANDDYASLLQEVGRLRARLGQIDRAARLLSRPGVSSVSELLDIANKYPAASSLREVAWQEAERTNEPYAWQQLIEDANGRGDEADLARAGQRAAIRLAGIDADRAEPVIRVARVLQTTGLTEQASKLIDPWRQWLNGKGEVKQDNILMPLIPVLVGLARDKDVETAIQITSSVSDRSRLLGIAADEYFRLGRSDVAVKFDHEALLSALASPVGDSQQQWAHHAALNNLALARAGRGDIEGALDVTAKMGNDTKMREVTSYVVGRAIDAGHGPVAGPAIEALQQQARAAQDISLLLQAANASFQVDNEKDARRGLDEVMKLVRERQASLDANDISVAAELTWRIDGNGDPRAMLGIVDRLDVKDPGAINRLVETMTPISAAVAVQLAGRQTEVERQIDELAAIGVAIAEGAK